MAKKKTEDQEKHDAEIVDALNAAIARINSKHKENTVVDIRKVDKSFKRVSTGIATFDRALGGGWPIGVVCELYGKNAAGKTTTVFEAARQFQLLVPNKQVLIIDAECKMHLGYGESLGVNLDTLIFSQTRSIEKICELIEELAPTKCISAIFIDSLAGLASEKELDTDMGDYTRNDKGMSLQKLGEMVKRMPQVAKKNDIFIAFTNQIRIQQSGYGNPEITMGGMAPGFWAALRVQLIRRDKINVDGVEVGHELDYYVEKNQTGMPHQTADVRLLWGSGVDRYDALLQAAVLEDVVKRNGAWYSFQDQKIGQGRENASQFLKDNENIYKQIYDLTLNDEKV